MKKLVFALVLATCLLTLANVVLGYTQRDPNDPLAGADDADQVLEIIKEAVLNQNIDDYCSVLSKDFVFVPDFSTAAMFPHIPFENWDIEMEKSYLTRFMFPSAKNELHFRVTEKSMPYDNQVRYEVTYNISVRSGEYTGEAAFYFEKINRYWFLWKWEELKPKECSFGYYPTSTAVRALLLP